MIKIEAALYLVQGMLAHPRRYKPREQDRDVHWHTAIAREALDIAEALEKESKQNEWCSSVTELK